MPRYTVWSKFDGQPLPARNRVERDELLAVGHHEFPVVAEHGPELIHPSEGDTVEVGGAGEPADPDRDDPAGSEAPQRVRNKRTGGRLVHPDTDADAVPDAADERDRTD